MTIQIFFITLVHGCEFCESVILPIIIKTINLPFLISGVEAAKVKKLFNS